MPTMVNNRSTFPSHVPFRLVSYGVNAHVRRYPPGYSKIKAPDGSHTFALLSYRTRFLCGTEKSVRSGKSKRCPKRTTSALLYSMGPRRLRHGIRREPYFAVPRRIPPNVSHNSRVNQCLRSSKHVTVEFLLIKQLTR